MNKNQSKHDQLAKKFLSDITIATEFLAIYLPEEIKNLCDLSTLKIESGSFIKDDLRQHISDILYQVSLHDHTSGSMYLYVLIEHQSSAELLMPFRIAEYTINILRKYINDNKIKSDETQNFKLPLVYPLLLYNGKRKPYPFTSEFARIFVTPELYQVMPLGNFKLIDLTILDDSEILQHKKVALLEILQKHIRDRDFANAVDVIASCKIRCDKK